MSRRRTWSDNALHCSFCHKSQDVVGKLISSPTDYPRAYICDECVAICTSIIEDDRESPERPPSRGPKVTHQEGRYLWDHPLAEEFMDFVEQWIVIEAEGRDASQPLAEMRRIAALMMSESPAS